MIVLAKGSGASRSDAPIHQGQWIAELLNALVMGRVAGRELEAMNNGDGRDHGIASADRPSDPIEIAGDLPSKVGGGLVEDEDFLQGDGVAKSLDTARSPDPLIP